MFPGSLDVVERMHIPDSPEFASRTRDPQRMGMFKRMETVLILMFSRGCDKSRGNRTSGV
jgi:hypothetical protein